MRHYILVLLRCFAGSEAAGGASVLLDRPDLLDEEVAGGLVSTQLVLPIQIEVCSIISGAEACRSKLLRARNTFTD